MKRKLLTLLLAVMAISLSACQEGGLYTGNLVLEGEHHIAEGQRLVGVVIMMDGNIVLEQGAQIDGPVYMLDGRLEADGEINGDLALIGGELVLGPNAHIGGNLNLGGGKVERSPEATIAGQVVTGIGLQVPDRPTLFRETLREQLPSFLIQAILLAFLAYLAVRWLPRPVNRVAKAIVDHPLVSGAMGLLVGIVALVLLILMAFTIILIPVSLLSGALFILAVVFGWIAFGMALGRYLSKQLKWDLQPDWKAALGTLLFVFVMNLLSLIPFIEGIIPIVLAVTGLGAVFLTRFGLREFVPVTEMEAAEFW